MTLLGAPTDHERKRLGQYFTGPTLSRLLASLADSASAARVIDPMAGSGDLVMAALERGGGWQRLDAIEIDPASCRRLQQSTSYPGAARISAEGQRLRPEHLAASGQRAVGFGYHQPALCSLPAR